MAQRRVTLAGYGGLPKLGRQRQKPREAKAVRVCRERGAEETATQRNAAHLQRTSPEPPAEC